MKLKVDPLTERTEALEFAQKLSGLTAGGSLGIIELDAFDVTAETLLDLTRRLVESKQPLEFFTYNRTVTYCHNCKKSWFGTLHKCPTCGSIGTLGTFDRFTST